MFQKFKYGNKISLMGYDVNDDKIKNIIINKQIELLSQPEWFAEASSATSWLFRSRYNIILILDPNVIHEFLDIDIINIISNIEEHGIGVNPNFDLDKKGSEVYNHIFTNKITGKFYFNNPESLYGILYYSYNNDTCNRSCKISQSKL